MFLSVRVIPAFSTVFLSINKLNNVSGNFHKFASPYTNNSLENNTLPCFSLGNLLKTLKAGIAFQQFRGAFQYPLVLRPPHIFGRAPLFDFFYLDAEAISYGRI